MNHFGENYRSIPNFCCFASLPRDTHRHCRAAWYSDRNHASRNRHTW